MRLGRPAAGIGSLLNPRTRRSPAASFSSVLALKAGPSWFSNGLIRFVLLPKYYMLLHMIILIDYILQFILILFTALL